MMKLITCPSECGYYLDDKEVSNWCMHPLNKTNHCNCDSKQMGPIPNDCPLPTGVAIKKPRKLPRNRYDCASFIKKDNMCRHPRIISIHCTGVTCGKYKLKAYQKKKNGDYNPM
jgi:hypothetical protein